jgi:hypothetical protein
MDARVEPGHDESKITPVGIIRGLRSRAFSGEVDTGSPQKMRPSKEIERFHDSTQHESALIFDLEHFQEKRNPVFRPKVRAKKAGK